MGLSSDPAAAERSKANLVPGGAPAEPGNRRAVKHGLYATLARERLDDKRREIFDALAEDAPLRERDGGLPAADAMIVELLAESICRRVGLREYLDTQAEAAKSKPPRPDTNLLDLERRLRKEAAGYADQLGLTPRSRTRIGLDLVHAAQHDLSTALGEPDPIKRRQMLIEMGRPDLLDTEPDGDPPGGSE